MTWSVIGSQGATHDGAGTISAAKPSGLAANDLLVAYGSCGTPHTIAAPVGWTEQVNSAPGGGFQQYLWSRIAGGSEPATYDFTQDVANYADLLIVAYRSSTGAPTLETGALGGRDASALTAHVITGQTATGSTDLLVMALANIADAVIATAVTGGTVDGSWAGTTAMGSHVLSAPGASGAQTMTTSNSTQAVWAILAAQEAVGGGGGGGVRRQRGLGGIDPLRGV